MKQFKFFAVALAAMTIFSCSKENTNETERQNGTKTMEITIAKSHVNPSSRAIQDPSASNYKTPINGDITVFFFASNDAEAPLLDRQTVSMTSSVDNYKGTATNVPSTSRYVYVVANTVPAATTIGATKLKDVRNQELQIVNSADFQDITKIPMTNATNDAQAFTDVTTPLMKVTVQIAPVMARIEVASTSSKADITAFDLVAVYMNGYYPSFTLGGEGAGTFVDHVKSNADLANAAAWTFDNYAGGLTQQTSYNAGAGKVWAYMMAPAEAGKLPTIVLQLDNVLVNGNTHNLNYITVKTFKKADQSLITTLDRNTIYKVTDISFSEDDTTVDPNQDKVSVEVTVEVLEWVEMTVEPGL